MDMINVCSMYLYLFLFIWKWRSIYSVWVNMCHLKWNFLLHFLRDLSNKLSFLPLKVEKRFLLLFFLSYVLMGHFLNLFQFLLNIIVLCFYTTQRKGFLYKCAIWWKVRISSKTAFWMYLSLIMMLMLFMNYDYAFFNSWKTNNFIFTYKLNIFLFL